MSSIYSQLAVKIGYSLADNSKADEYLQNNGTDFNLFRNNYNFGLGYQYIFEGTGMSLVPGLLYTYSETSVGLAKLKLSRFSVELPLKIFPFNMEGDCNCPDFSIRNKFFEKHFFLLINSGVNYSFKNNSHIEGFVIKDISYTAGIGTGISIPMAKNLLFSPAINYKWFFDDKWEKKYLFTISEEEFNTSFNELEIEIRMIYKLK